MARTCMHIVLRSSADACLIVPILADHPGGAARCHAVRVVRAGLPLRPRRPSGHSREKEEVREGTAQEEVVAWAEQFPRGGGLSGACRGSQEFGRSTHTLCAPKLISVSIGLIIACLLSTAARPSVRAVGIAQ